MDLGNHPNVEIRLMRSREERDLEGILGRTKYVCTRYVSTEIVLRGNLYTSMFFLSLGLLAAEVDAG